MSDFTGHTPGPWEFDEGNMGSSYGRPYYGIITNSLYSVFIHVGAAADDYRGNAGRENECIENARLIAAAPDILAERDKLWLALGWYARESTWIAKGGIVNAPIAYDGGERAATLLFALQEASDDE